MNKSILGTAFTSVSFAAFAAVTNVWTGAVNDSDWSNAGNYEKGLPSAEDVVQIPGGKTVRLVGTDSASLAVVNSLSRIMPLAADSRLQIETPTGVDIAIDCAISYPIAAESDPEADFGEVIKKGTGTLSLRSAETRDYCTSFTVEEGVLRLLVDAQKSTPYSFTRLYVAEGATLFTVSNRGYTFVRELLGSGLVTNDCASECYLQIWGGTVDKPVRLEARLAPNVRYYSVGSVDVLSTGNTMTAAFSVKGKSMSSGAVTAGTGLLKLGNSGESGSPGTAQRLYYNEFGGTYRYLGTGERTTKGLLITTAPDQAGSSLFDGGLHGGLEFCDSSWTAWNMVANLVLAGTNASPCVIHSPIVSYARAAGTNHCMTLTKRGSGTWRLAHSLSRDGIAGLCIEEGVMQIDSLYEKGEACALGAATTNYPANYMGVYDPLSWVPYSIALGAPGKTAPLLELVGTNGAWSSKREFVLRGDARIKNSALDDSGNAVPLRLSGFSSVADGVNTLFLEENGSGEDEIGGLSDGEDGRLALVKNGGGNWYLVGTNTFTGGLAVSNGTLTILSPSGKYTWYRWIVKQTKGNGGEMIAYEFGLYDANSNRVNSALSMNPNYASIRGGQVSYQKRMTDWQNRGVKDADRLFDDSTTDWRTFDKSEGARPLSVGDPASWFCVLMKLDADCEEVCSYDVVANGTSGYAPAVWTLEASVDGFTWDEVDNVDSIPFAADSFKWAWGTKTKYSDGTAAVHGGGRPIAGNTNKLVQALSPDCPVSVAPGATLACRGTATLANLSIDCNGAGTIDGFGFAAAGTLNVQNLPEDGAVLPVRFTNVSGAANIADWSLFVNGVPNGKCKICVSGDGEIRILKPGTVIVFR